MRVLRTLAAEGRSHLVTLGMTPVVTAQLDDPYCLTGMQHWLANWQLRAREAATLRGGTDDSGYATPEAMRAFGIREYDEAGRALEDFATHWRHGGSPLLRQLIDAEAIELLGGPLAHPFQPLLNPRLREFALREGLADAGQRFAHMPSGIWAPECAYAPGMEDGLRRRRRDALHGRRSDAARRHRARPSGRRLRRHRVRPRPAGQLPGVVAEVRLSRARRLPRLLHLRPRHRPQARPGHRTRGAVARTRRPTTPSAPTRAIDVHVADFVDMVRRRLHVGVRRASAGPRTSSRRSTPSCSATGGTRARCGSSGCCARCPRPGCASARCPTRSTDGFVGSSRRIAAQLLGFRQGLAGVVGEQVADSCA